MSTTRTLFDAARAGDLDTLRELLDADPSLARARDDSGLPPILVAGYHGQRDAMAVLAERTPEMDLFEASAAGELERLRTLLNGAPGLAGTRSGDGWTAVHLAAFFGRMDAVRLLLERGAPAGERSTNAMANMPLHAAMAGRLGAKGLCLLLDHGAEVDAQQHGGYTVLHAASMHGDEELVRLLLERGADPLLRTDDGRTAADFAREHGYAKVADLLDTPY
jgi:ankyrin repeat protein